MLTLLLFIACESTQPAEGWGALPASTHCSEKAPEFRDSCRVEECRSVVAKVGPPSSADAPALTTLCEMAEASNSEGAQYCGLQSCYYLPQVQLSEAMRILQSSLPVSANQKRSRAAIIRGLLEQDELFALALDGALGSPLKNSAWYGLAVAELDCEMAGISKDLGLECPSVSAENVERILSLAEASKGSEADYHTLLNLASAADFSVAAEALTVVVSSETSSNAEQKAAIGAIQIGLLRGERLPKSLVKTWVELCNSPKPLRQTVCARLLK